MIFFSKGENNFPFVSVIIPCRNEEGFIGKCLDTIISQDYPKENLEILVVDGDSEDKTREIIKSFALEYAFVKLLENQNKYIPFGLNIGIKKAKGDIIIRMDAHAGYEKDYVSKCVKYLNEYNADNVGGVIKTLPAKNTLTARAIAITLSTIFGAASSFRIGSKEARETDTVFGGCYKKEIFKKIGYFNEKLIRSQDIEFNKRLKRAAGKIILVPDIVAFYYPQSTFFGFLKHNFQDGLWVTYPLKFGIRFFSLRHLLPLFLVSGFILLLIFSFFLKIFLFLLLFSLSFYFFISFLFSLATSLREKDIRLLFFLIPAFANRHFSYGFGSLCGIIKIFKD